MIFFFSNFFHFQTFSSYFQTTYVKNRFTGETESVISDILDTLALEDVLVSVDIENVFDSLNHCLLLKFL